MDIIFLHTRIEYRLLHITIKLYLTLHDKKKDYRALKGMRICMQIFKQKS